MQGSSNQESGSDLDPKINQLSRATRGFLTFSISSLLAASQLFSETSGTQGKVQYVYFDSHSKSYDLSWSLQIPIHFLISWPPLYPPLLPVAWASCLWRQYFFYYCKLPDLIILLHFGDRNKSVKFRYLENCFSELTKEIGTKTTYSI